MITPEEEDKPFMIETAVFIFLMVVCACGLMYGFVKLLIFFFERVNKELI